MRSVGTRKTAATRQNIRLALQRWAELPTAALTALQELTEAHQLSIALGDLLYIDGRWYVSHVGLLRTAMRNRCAGIHVRAVSEFSDPGNQRWAFEATVYKSRDCRGFVGYGDADLSNVSPLV